MVRETMVALLVAGLAHAESPRRFCKDHCWPTIDRCIVRTAKFRGCIRDVRRQCRRDPRVCGATTSTTLPNFLPATRSDRPAKRACRAACAPAVAACIADGGKRRPCTRRAIRQCRRAGLGVCATTTTTTPVTTTTTTTAPGGIALIHYATEQTSIETVVTIALSGFFGNLPIALDPAHFTLRLMSGAVIAASPARQPGDCTATTVVQSDATVACRVRFPHGGSIVGAVVWFDDGRYRDSASL